MRRRTSRTQVVDASRTRSQAESVSAEPWLLLVHQLPPRPVAARVKIWRRLRHLGAVAVKSSVYVLPNRAEAREDFEWVRAETVALGGQATVFQASTLDAMSSVDIREAFRRDRQERYRRMAGALEKLARHFQRGGGRSNPRALEKAVRAYRDQLHQVEALDYFAADGRKDARAALARLEALSPVVPKAQKSPDAPLDRTSYRRRRWLTRSRPGIDRMASAWLIRRFIDPEATFVFGEPGPKRESGTITFDMFEGDFTHEGDRCTFEVLCRRFEVKDRRLSDIAELVHDLDLKDGRYGRADAVVLAALIEGLRRLQKKDDELLEQGMALFEALYQGQATAETGAPTRQMRTRKRPLGAGVGRPS